jgi:hypothetical protein
MCASASNCVCRCFSFLRRLCVLWQIGTRRCRRLLQSNRQPSPCLVPRGRTSTSKHVHALRSCLQANAEHFAPELPFIEGGSNAVLYPSSAKASSLLQEGLAARGFSVLRLNTYDTRAVQSVGAGELTAARGAAVIAVASPSAVK